MASKGEARCLLPKLSWQVPGVWAPQRQRSPRAPPLPAAGPAPRLQSAARVPGRKGVLSSRGRCRLLGACPAPGPPGTCRARAEERRRQSSRTPAGRPVRPAGSSEVLLPPDPILAAATAEGDGSLLRAAAVLPLPHAAPPRPAQLALRERQDKSSFLCKRSERPPPGPHPRGPQCPRPPSQGPPGPQGPSPLPTGRGPLALGCLGPGRCPRDPSPSPE